MTPDTFHHNQIISKHLHISSNHLQTFTPSDTTPFKIYTVHLKPPLDQLQPHLDNLKTTTNNLQIMPYHHQIISKLLWINYKDHEADYKYLYMHQDTSNQLQPPPGHLQLPHLQIP